ncbi:MAG: DUF1028 domain-containing protein [Alphaproteobacteria bacterium]|nr:DUF1028 domain-containing protein [Alphaproteobacteria bacterium]
MTWSVVARDPETGAFGVAVTTCFFAVGALCPFAASGIGAVSTQALVNPLLGLRALRLLAEEISAASAPPLLLMPDEGREHRQLHLIDRAGDVAAHTGSACIGWCGHVQGAQVSVAGNMLTGPEVVTASLAAYEAASGPFARRLLAALDAGQVAGGDKRGRQSAALLVCSTEPYPDLDLRVDDHPEPLVELRRLYDLSRRYAPYRRFMPSRANPSGLHDRAALEAALARARAEPGE